MFSDRIATFRSDDTVEREVNTVRRWGDILQHNQFNIVRLIEGPLRQNLDFFLFISFRDSRLDAVPAFVSFERANDRATLFVRRSVWNLADANQSESRFVLAHEIGHLKMHRRDALGFSNTNESVLADMQEEERVEPQANKFADRLLVAESLLRGFSCGEEIAYFFNVPIVCVQRRFDYMQDQARRRKSSQIGEACPECANLTLVRNGTCLKCETCESTTRCL